MKILIIGDIHIGTSRESTTHPGVVRQANNEAENNLSKIVQKLNNQNFDLIVHTGDALRDTLDKEMDASNLKKALQLLSMLKAPTLHLLGNHELAAFNFDEVKKLYQDSSIKPEFFGYRDSSDFRFIWLDLELTENHRAKVPQKTLDWLNELTISDLPSIVLTHFSLSPIDDGGSFYFEEKPEDMFFDNSEEVISILEKHKPVIAINGHVHLFTHQQKRGIHFLSAPSFSENIAAQKYLDNNPAVYSILNLHKDSFVFSSFSEDFCFAKTQADLLYV